MFGLTIEKLFLVAVIAAIVIGPQRLPVYATRLAELIRSLRAYVESTRARAENETGLPLTRAQWESLDLSHTIPAASSATHSTDRRHTHRSPRQPRPPRRSRPRRRHGMQTPPWMTP
jgi:hypothetical protein